MKKQLADIWAYAQSVAASEGNLPEPPDLTTFNKEKVQDIVEHSTKCLLKSKTSTRK